MPEKALSLFLILFFLVPAVSDTQDISIADNFFFIDDEKFFIKGIGYEVNATPGNVPWVEDFQPGVIHADMQRIEDAGFNTIRTWAAFSPQELNIVSQYNIKIIMGIWVDPHGDFADPGFVQNARSHVSNILSYSRNYDNIIAYLIMNEPLPEYISAAGYEATTTLWTELIEMINEQHPDRPVSIANTCNGTYIDPGLFGFSAYNAYIYNPVTINALHGYRDYVAYLQKLNNHPDRPLIMTEFGLSVSPSGPGNWGYGGNTLEEQSTGILHMYKALVDGGASGACVFNYSDGWWKGGNEWSHDDSPEEWFGLVQYHSLSDQYGTERPVWQQVKMFQSAIITEPKSGEIYGNQIPVEVFSSDPVSSVKVYHGQNLLFEKALPSDYLLEDLTFNTNQITDAILSFQFYDQEQKLIKAESKNILVAPFNVVLPSIDIVVENEDFWNTHSLEVRYEVTKSPGYLTGSMVDYIYYPHIGFDYGVFAQRPMESANQFTFETFHAVSEQTDILTVGAAFDISFNSFEKRIVNQRTFSRINEVTTKAKEVRSGVQDVHVFPNPTNGVVSLSANGLMNGQGLTYTIHDLEGHRLSGEKPVESDGKISLEQCLPGLYLISFFDTDHRLVCSRKVVKVR